MKKLKVVFDFDGPLFDLIKALEVIKGIPVEKFEAYSFWDNKRLTKEELDTIVDVCRTDELYVKYPMRELACVTKLHETGMADIYVHSLCWSEIVEEIKCRILMHKTPWMPIENMVFDVGSTKSILEDVDILVEDSAKNIDNSKARVMNLFFPQHNIKQTVMNPLFTEVHSLEEACDWILRYLNNIS